MQKINWQQYFSKTIIDRGRSYYKNGKVRNLRKQGDKYYAKVQGSYPYEVAIWKKANNQLGMSCDCMYATDGNYCKHMAAVCMKIEEEFGAEERKQIVPQAAKNPEVQVKPFKKKNVKGAKEYTCFDLSRMTEDIKIMDSQWKAAQKLVEKNMMKLQTVREGYMNNGYGESVPAGAVTAYYEEAGRTSQINIRFSSRKILEAVCRVPNCNYIHYDYSYSTKEKLCKHQLAVLQLLENYIEEYNPGDTTDVRALDFIEHYQKKQRSQALAKADAEVRDLQIEPRIEWTENGLEASFRTGTKKLYIIKNLDEFVEKVENKATQAFGSTSEIDYAVHKVAPQAEKYYSFIRKVIKGERLRLEAGEFYVGDIKVVNKIQLYGRRLDEMFDLLLQEQGDIPFHDKILGEKYNKMFVEERIPRVELTLENDYENSVFRGIKVFGNLPEFIQGERHIYYLKAEHLCRIDQEKESIFLPLMEAAVSDKISFKIGRKALPDFYYYTLPALSKVISIVDKTGNRVSLIYLHFLKIL